MAYYLCQCDHCLRNTVTIKQALRGCMALMQSHFYDTPNTDNTAMSQGRIALKCLAWLLYGCFVRLFRQPLLFSLANTGRRRSVVG